MDHNFLCKKKNLFKKKISLVFLARHRKQRILMGKILLILFENVYLLFSKHVVFGHVISGESVVDAIENMAVDSNSRPLKDVVVSHCGQLVLVSSKIVELMFVFIENLFVNLENKKEKKRKISTEDENEDNQESESSSSSDENDKKKKKSKHKKKEKHRKKKEAKRLAKISIEEENRSDQITNTTIEKSNEISGRDIMGLKTTIDPDEIPEIPAHKFLMRRNLTDSNNNNNNETPNTRYENSLINILQCEFCFSTSNYRSSKKIDSSGRPVKGRGFMVSCSFFLFNLF
jgi:hypothetical protein